MYFIIQLKVSFNDTELDESAIHFFRSWNNRFFRENPPFVSVQVGSDYYEHGGENIDAQEIYFHPTYDPKTLNNNLAIIRLSRRINFRKKSRRVKKIDIDRSPSKWIPNKRSDLVTVVGWGAKDVSMLKHFQ